MNIFKVSYKVVRDNSKEIYRGFGFKHLSDATQYYVHPDNQSFKGTTTLCQPIGEAIILFSSMLTGIIHGTGFGDYYVSDDNKTFLLELNVPADYRIDGVIEPAVFQYRALSEGDRLTVAAYDRDGRWLDGNMEHLHPLYKLLPAFCVLLAREAETNPDYRAVLDSFLESPEADTFVNLHEDFYQMHKLDDYDFTYADLPSVDKDAYRSFSSGYQIISHNRTEMQRKKKQSFHSPMMPLRTNRSC